MEKGTVVEFLVKGTPRLAVVEALEGKSNLKVTDTFGNSLTVAPRDLEFQSSTYKLSDRGPVPASGLVAWRDRAATARSDIDLATVWELLAGTAPQPLEALADCLWDSLTSERAYALFSVLREDRQYFKEKGGKYEPRPAAQVEELRKQQDALAAKEKLQNEMVARLQARFAGSAVALGADELKRLESVKKYALWGDEAPDKNAGLELLKLLDRPQTEAGAFQLAVDAGVWNHHENLDVHRAGLTALFEPELEAIAADVGPRKDPGRTVDLTSLASVTIDDDSTTEVDDALAVETLADGRVRYWVHIADPGRWIAPGTPLDVEARRRGTTVYLPTGRFTMFPPALAEGPFSLNPGVDAPALSFGCFLAPDGALTEFTVVPSVIRVARRLSYHQAEELLASNDPLVAALAATAALREAWRRSQGAVMISLPETEVKVDLAANTVSIGVYTADAAREWVAEFMILAGEAAARFAADKQVPILYRVQRPGDPIDVGHLPPGPVQEFAKIVSMTRSGLAVESGPHAGLGMASYVQATSPIRRYGDLVVHRQLKAAAADEAPPYSADDLAILAAELDPLNGQAAKMERNADRYWVTEYLARHKGKVWDVLFLGWFREPDRLAQVLIEELGYRVTMKLPKDKALGERFTVKAAAADPRKEVLNLVEV